MYGDIFFTDNKFGTVHCLRRMEARVIWFDGSLPEARTRRYNTECVAGCMLRPTRYPTGYCRYGKQQTDATLVFPLCSSLMPHPQNLSTTRVCTSRPTPAYNLQLDDVNVPSFLPNMNSSPLCLPPSPTAYQSLHGPPALACKGQQTRPCRSRPIWRYQAHRPQAPSA